jgi:SpoVK/Ycf46/Vps4 family AAA+-type ATPase
MARADLILNIVQSGLSGDKAKLKKATEAVIAEERSKHHNVLATKLEEMLHTTPPERPINGTNGRQIMDQRINNLVYEVNPQKKFDDIILPDDVKLICQELIQEQFRSDLLRSYNLEPRNRVLLIGPPGNGKTSLAEAIAESLMVPLLVVRYESIIGAYLGETAVRLRNLIDYACTRKCVLFFDEFETLGKERGDTHETGEIKRVVSSLLLQIDTLPSHVVVIGATNHPELLDRAVWRRFQVRMEIPSPTRSRLTEWFERFERKIKIPLGLAPETLAKRMQGANFAEVEEFGRTVFRQYVLGQPDAKMKDIVQRTLKNWGVRTAQVDQKQQGDE